MLQQEQGHECVGKIYSISSLVWADENGHLSFINLSYVLQVLKETNFKQIDNKIWHIYIHKQRFEKKALDHIPFIGVLPKKVRLQ